MVTGCKSACGKYSAGMLRSQITIQAKATTPDWIGGVVDTWAPVTAVWAMWRVMSAGERYAAQRIHPTAAVKAVVRFRDDGDGQPMFTPAMRVLYRGRTYAVLSVVDPDDRREWLEMVLAEGAPS